MSEKKTDAPLIYKKMVDIMQDIGVIAKTEKNKAQGFVFRGIDNVMNELHDIFAKHGVFIIPNIVDYKTSQHTVEKEYQGQISSTIWTTAYSKYEYTFMAEDGSNIKASVVGEGKDAADKAMNKAMSIALKYVLLQMFMIPTAEKKDPDYDDPQTTASKQQTDNIMLTQATKEVNGCKNVADLEEVWRMHPSLQKNPAFVKLVTDLKLKLVNGN